MCRMDCCWLWVPPFGSVLFRPGRSRCRRAALVALLLLASGNVEANPGPPRKRLVSLGCLNIRSGVKKAAVLHDIISDRRLDVLAMQESWIPSDAPAAVKNDIAPVGYTALHDHRELRPDGPKRGGGLAVVHRNSLVVRDFSLPTGSIQPKASEMQLVRITSSNSRPVVLANINRPPKCPVLEFLDELLDVVTSFYTASNDQFVLCGDVNCPGVDGTCVDNSLASMLDSLGLDQLVTSPTCDDNLMDILATDTSESLSDVEIDDAGCISDHRLVHANLAFSVPTTRVITSTFRNIKMIIPASFEMFSGTRCFSHHLPPSSTRSPTRWSTSSQMS